LSFSVCVLRFLGCYFQSEKMRVGRTYVYERSINKNRTTTYTILAVLAGLGCAYTGYKSFTSLSQYRDVSSSLKSLIVHPSGYGYNYDPANNGDVIHVNIPQKDLIFERSVHDPFLNVDVPGAVTLNRQVEYCQWAEHVHERTEKVGQDRERVIRTYSYTKTWRPYLINSLFFDQPAAHHNPQRNPVSSALVDQVGISSTTGFSIAAPYMDSLREGESIISFRPEKLQGFVSSPAYNNEKFFYTGNNGYFLSKYNPSTAETAMKIAFQYLEGSLLDFQLGDLFSVCDAGDVRVQLRGKVLNNGISVIAQQNNDGSLVPFQTLSGRDLIILRPGQLSAKRMIDDEISHHFQVLLLFVLGTVALAGLVYLFVHLLNKERQKQNDNVKKDQ